MSTVQQDESIHDRRNFRTDEGFDGTNIPTDFMIPPCGLEDVDRALYELFDSKILFEIQSNDQMKKVPVIFATGERFVLTKHRKPIRDKNGTFILPLISIRRTGINQSMQYQMGMGQNPGELTIKHRLSRHDPTYQALINKRALKNQSSAAYVSHMLTNNYGVEPGQVATRRDIVGTHKTTAGDHLADTTGDMNNIIEFITMPFPHFYTAKYEVVFWAQHTTNINTMLQQLMFAYSAQGNFFKITSPKGYFFVAFVNDELSPDSNNNDFADNERVIKYVLTIDVPAYILAPTDPGGQITLRRFFSSPQISFDLSTGAVPVRLASKSSIGASDPSEFVLDDIYVKDQHGDNVTSDRILDQYTLETIENPFTDKLEKKLVRIKTRNQRKGETVTSARSITVVDTVTL